jgi:tRNA wybutosine-synthesizing protein 1
VTKTGSASGRKVDDPETIVENSIHGQRMLVSGFKGDPRCDEAMWEEARNPNQVAISLSGEPTLYPYLSDLIGLYRRRGMTVFVVTNGTRPDLLEDLDELPTQLYVSVDAPDHETFRSLCRPMGDSRARWDSLQRTLELFPSLDTRKVVRHTLLGDGRDGEGDPASLALAGRGNMGNVDGFADLVKKADPDFVEPKGYVFVGSSRMRLNIGYMPQPGSVRGFAEELAEKLGYTVEDEMPASRAVLLSSGRISPAIRDA